MIKNRHHYMLITPVNSFNKRPTVHAGPMRDDSLSIKTLVTRLPWYNILVTEGGTWETDRGRGRWREWLRQGEAWARKTTSNNKVRIAFQSRRLQNRKHMVTWRLQFTVKMKTQKAILQCVCSVVCRDASESGLCVTLLKQHLTVCVITDLCSDPKKCACHRRQVQSQQKFPE